MHRVFGNDRFWESNVGVEHGREFNVIYRHDGGNCLPKEATGKAEGIHILGCHEFMTMRSQFSYHFLQTNNNSGGAQPVPA